MYAFPFAIDATSLGPDQKIAEAALEEGYSTVLRLPLSQGVSRSDVEQHLTDTLLPKLLLFLAGVDELELRGTSSDFVAVATRDTGPHADEVLLESNGRLENWLVFRRGCAVDRTLVDPLGDSWADIEMVHVAVAVELSEARLPLSTRTHPLHVYFPTEEATSLPLIIQGDFALQLDRRQLASNPEAVPYNSWLLDQVAAHLGDVVAPALAGLFPGAASVVAAMTPHASGTGWGADCLRRCIAALRGSRFLPAVDGHPRLPAEALMLPASIPSAEEVSRHLHLDDLGRMTVPEVQDSPVIRTFLVKALGVTELTVEEALQRLSPPEDGDLHDFYGTLVDWGEGHGSRRFAAQLAHVRCVHTTTDDWVTPKERVFFPRKRDDVIIPADLPVPIAALPEVDGLVALLEQAGVRPFEWRDLLGDYLLPLLTDPNTEPDLRDRAMDGLRAYFVSQRTGDDRVRRVLVPARRASGGAAELRTAATTYFPSSWISTDALEKLYGPFDEPEFLALPPPTQLDAREAECEFLRWMGVGDTPRVFEARADPQYGYMVGSWHRHPHRALEPWSSKWWSDGSTLVAKRCSQGHPESQQLQESFTLDRFAEIVESQDPERLRVLWRELAAGWSRKYEPARWATFRCVNTTHGGERNRRTPSLFGFMLAHLEWVPARLGDRSVLVAPAAAWRPASDTPKWVTRRTPSVEPWMTQGSGLTLATALEIVDAARPSPGDLVRLLERLHNEYEEEREQSRELLVAARWAMRALNDALADEPDADVKGVYLLCRHRGNPVYTQNPLVALDPMLEETWEQYYPMLDADRDLRRLYSALGLTVLDDPSSGMKVAPAPMRPRHDLQAAIEDHLNRAKPFLAAVAVQNTPSREETVIRGLKRLEVLACEDLILRYTYDDTVVERSEAVSYIAVRQEVVRGALRRNIGTAHLEVDPRTSQPDWYSFGPQLAQFLEVPTMGDAFAVLLTGNEHDNARYLASRRLAHEAVDRMRGLLELAGDDVISTDVFDLVADPTRSPDAPVQPVGPTAEAPTPPQTSLTTTTTSPEAWVEPTSPPALEDERLTIQFVDPQPVMPPTPRSGGGGLGPAGPVDHVADARRAHEVGKRGEEAVLRAERQRVAGFGCDPEAVIWRSERNPFAPYDIESLDEDGQRIYIEVKATISADASAPFLISAAELLEAVKHRSRYFIYRVTDVDSAAPPIWRYQDPVGLLLEGRASLRLSDARMVLGESK